MKTINAEPTDVNGDGFISASQAVATIERRESAVGKALTVHEMTDRLRLIKSVMQENMTVDVDYGKVPGCGDKPGLFQPGAQKLSMMFQLSPEVRQETISEFDNYHRGYRLVVRVSNGSKFADGVGECSTLEKKYRYRNAGRVCPKCHKESVIEGKAEFGGGYLCFKKKGGCGEKFAVNSELGKKISEQAGGQVENENPPDHWNTVRKMAFKRAFVHAIINATNTSELWSQDLEDLHANGVSREDTRQQNNSGASGGASRPAEGKSSSANRKPTMESKAVPENRSTGTAKPSSQPIYATPISRMKFLHTMGAAPGEPGEMMMHQFCIAAGIILENESVIDMPLRYVPIWGKQVDLWKAAIDDFESGGDAIKPFTNQEDPNLGAAEEPARKPKPVADAASLPPQADDDPWRRFVIPFGKQKGVLLGVADKKWLYGMWANFVVETEYKGRPKKPETIKKDEEFRAHLHAAGEHYKFTKDE